MQRATELSQNGWAPLEAATRDTLKRAEFRPAGGQASASGCLPGGQIEGRQPLGPQRRADARPDADFAVAVVAFGVEDLRHQADIGHRRPAAVAEHAGGRIAEHRLDRIEAGLDPMAVPG
jgi:hypothetical protein